MGTFRHAKNAQFEKYATIDGNACRKPCSDKKKLSKQV